MPSMTGWITSALFLAAIASGAAAQEKPLAVGAVVSQTGSHAAAAADYRKGLLLWADQVNAEGGLLGRPIDLQIKDDASEAARAGSAYAELITGGAQVLFGPFGSAATLTGSAEAERSRLARHLFGGDRGFPAAALQGDEHARRCMGRLWRGARRRRHGKDAQAPRLRAEAAVRAQ